MSFNDLWRRIVLFTKAIKKFLKVHSRPINVRSGSSGMRQAILSDEVKEAKMTIKHWDDKELAKVSADLDAELEQLFDEMETVLAAHSDDDGPTLEFLPDEEEAAEEETPPRGRRPRQNRESEPPKTILNEDDFREKPAAIALPTEEKEKMRQPEAPRPRPRRALTPPPTATNEHELPEAEVLPDDYMNRAPLKETIASLSPDDFSRLMERAVARGVLAALKKWPRPSRD